MPASGDAVVGCVTRVKLWNTTVHSVLHSVPCGDRATAVVGACCVDGTVIPSTLLVSIHWDNMAASA